jgi:hypothetical protein
MPSSHRVVLRSRDRAALNSVRTIYRGATTPTIRKARNMAIIMGAIRADVEWVISRHDGPFASCPLYSRYRTFVGGGVMSEKRQKRTSQ